MDELLAVVPPIFWLAAQKSNPPRHTFNLSLRNQCIVAEKWKKKATVDGNRKLSANHVTLHK